MKARPLAAVLVVVAAALVAAAPASAARIKGTVVHQNHRGHSFVVADRAGNLKAIHASKRPRTGSVVTVAARRLRNGTFSASKIRASGHRRHARIRGVVTWVNRRTGEFTVSSEGASLLVRKHARKARGASAADNSTPNVGSQVTADVTIDDNGDLEEQDVQETGQANNTMDLEGVVLSADTTANTITVSADDNNDSGSANGIVVHVPDASKFPVGSEVELAVTGPAADGSFTLAQSSLDDNQQEADDSSHDQGNGDNGDNHGNGNGDNGGGNDKRRQ